MELRVGYLDRFGAGVVGSGRAAMAFTLGRRRCRRGALGASGRRRGKSWPIFSVLAPKIIRANRPRVVFLASMAPMSHWRVRNTFSTNW